MSYADAGGGHSVKSCGNAHAWCRVCRPEQIKKLQKPKPPRKSYSRPCRNCGSCDDCLGLTAPDGQKFCRKCEKIKPIEQFRKGGPGRGRRNQCNACSSKKFESLSCEKCTRTFWRTKDSATTHCSRCIRLVGRACSSCGAEFTGSNAQKKYCSPECRSLKIAQQRASKYRSRRHAALSHYSNGTPRCSCCGETELLFLALDHINGGGRQHRISIGGGGYWHWLAKNGYPEGFQVLCHNCNHGRQINGGHCPHRNT